MRLSVAVDIEPNPQLRRPGELARSRRDHPPNDSTIPTRLWRDGEDAAVRTFYGKLNPKSKVYAWAFGAEVD